MIIGWLHARKEDLKTSSYINLISNAEILVKNEGGYCFTIEELKKMKISSSFLFIRRSTSFPRSSTKKPFVFKG